MAVDIWSVAFLVTAVVMLAAASALAIFSTHRLRTVHRVHSERSAHSGRSVCMSGRDDDFSVYKLLMPTCVDPFVTRGAQYAAVDEFPRGLPPFVRFMSTLDAQALTAVVKAKYARFEPLITASKWTVTFCYVPQAPALSSAPAQSSAPALSSAPTLSSAPALSSADAQVAAHAPACPVRLVLHVRDADDVARAVLLSAPAVAGLADKVWALYSTDPCAYVDNYHGQWTQRTLNSQDGEPGEFAVFWPRYDGV